MYQQEMERAKPDQVVLILDQQNPRASPSMAAELKGHPQKGGLATPSFFFFFEFFFLLKKKISFFFL